MFGTPGGGAIGPKGPVFGSGGNARRIVFVCDASGVDGRQAGVAQGGIGEGGRRPAADPAVHVIFFAGDAGPRGRRRKAPARDPGKQAQGEQVPRRTDGRRQVRPDRGVRPGFKQQPQLLYLLTDGDFADNNAVLKRVRELNADKRVKINTIAFVNAGDTDRKFLDVLETIARENGGVFRLVAEDKLER